MVAPVSVSAQKERDAITMEEVVVTATKTKEKRKDIPNAVIIMDEIDIQESSANSLGELLANELGIDWRTRGDYGGATEEIHVRGMGSNATQILINGVSIVSPSLGSASVQGVSLNNIERIEVIKGSGSLLYGSGAMGGTVNIITKEPKRDIIDAKASAGYGSENTYRLSAEHGMFAFGDFGYYLTANRHETDGFRDNSDLTHKDVSLKLLLDKGDWLDVSIYGDYIDREFGQPGVKPPDSTDDYFVNGEKLYSRSAASLVDRHRDEDGHTVIKVKSKPYEWLCLNLKADYTDMESYNYRRNNAAVWPKVAGEGEETWVTNKVTGTEGNLELKPYRGASLIFGSEYKNFDYENVQEDLDDTGITKAGTKTTMKHRVFTKSVFAEAQYRPCKFFKLLAGIRQENHSLFGTEDLPRYGLVINPFEKTVIKFSHGKHFKAPTMNDLYWPDDGWTKGNTDLIPETGWHTDATVEQSLFDDDLFITLTYFNWDLEDKINWAEDPTLNGYWTPSNVDTYKAQGWELGTRIRPFKNIALNLSYTYTDAIEEKKDCARRQALYTPEHQFKGNLSYYSDFGMSITTTVRYVGDRPAHYNNSRDDKPDYTLSSYWTTDLKIEQRLFDHWIFSLQGNNLFDEQYGTYVADFKDENTGVTTREEYPGAGSSIFFNVSYEY
ncbi:TonB-dependent receptor [Patescibacteria group bacterium]|nr:TonB-dependent receptor [Patescibacteria group bacterium]